MGKVDVAQPNVYASASWPECGKYQTEKMRIAMFKKRSRPESLYSYITTYVDLQAF